MTRRFNRSGIARKAVAADKPAVGDIDADEQFGDE